MLLEDVQRGYVFPRIPLNLELPEGYPDIGYVSNISVVPEVSKVRHDRQEIEIKGTYEVSVSYVKAETGPEEQVTVGIPGCENFFSQVKLQADGLLSDETDPEHGQVSGELYTFNFTRPFHTFVDLDAVRTKNPRPLMVVERVHLEQVEGRKLKGELIFGLVNRSRWQGR